MKSDQKTVPPARLRRLLLAWYDAHRRVLPWRAAPGQKAEPYHVWLSEIMLQQTTVVTVGPYFLAFLERWPTVEALAAASLDDVLHGWQGLGYYARARNLHRCATLVAGEHGGIFPDQESALLELPGIGVYTAAAIAAIAFDRPASVMDGNVERVMARLFAVEAPLPAVKPVLRKHADALAPTTRRGRPGDYAQGLMDLGATLCTPRAPACGRCPWASACRARAMGSAGTLPRKSPKPVKPVRQGVVFWIIRPDGAVLIRRRPEKGLLGGMMEFPSTDWREGDWSDRAAHLQAPLEARWRPLPGIVRHTFTHFHLQLSVHAATIDRSAAATAQGVWCPPHKLGDYALPTVMKKLVTHVMRTGAA